MKCAGGNEEKTFASGYAADKKVLLFDYKAMLKKFDCLAQISTENIFDCKLACYLTDSSLDCSSLEKSAASLFKENVAAESTPAELLGKIYEFTAPSIAENPVFRQIEIPLSPVLAAMEKRGIMLDGEGLEEFGKKLSGELQTVEKMIYDAVGKTFNINSTKQLNALLFEELKLEPAGKKTKSGYSTDAEALEKMIDMHPVISLILKYRKIAKVYSTYVEGLLKYLQSDGKVHTSFNMTATATGR